MVDAYADAGGNVIDTAINYRGGASEEIVGELLEAGATASCWPRSTR